MQTKDILKALRKSKGYSNMKDFCEVSGISFNTYQNYETGKRIPPAEILIKLADFYGVTTDYLLGREQPDEQPDPLKVLSKQQNMDEVEEIFLQKYLAMPQEGRDAIIEMMRSVIDVFRNNSNQGITVSRAARSSSGRDYEPPGEVKMTQEEIDEIVNAEDVDDL